eukprot:gnl/Dysnectes_brevis/3214_a4016_956.p1 GENE.gnl/Dysnectes_brevis/3214_a4016_956~~gnl/Dysnectes_brevis/3214_a4016_956.p1  ORF type:complete len:216 (-),score=33.17 gnl/Dysnectes_brevis/3214_a4016_956:79-726(-)
MNPEDRSRITEILRRSEVLYKCTTLKQLCEQILRSPDSLTRFDTQLFTTSVTETTETEQILLFLANIYNELSMRNLQAPTGLAAGLVTTQHALAYRVKLILSYLRTRLAIITTLAASTRRLPPTSRALLDPDEQRYLTAARRLRTDYGGDLGLDLNTDLVPAESLFVEICVGPNDLGELDTAFSTLRLTPHSIHYCRRVDVEGLIHQGLVDVMEE